MAVLYFTHLPENAGHIFVFLVFGENSVQKTYINFDLYVFTLTMVVNGLKLMCKVDCPLTANTTLPIYSSKTSEANRHR